MMCVYLNPQNQIKLIKIKPKSIWTYYIHMNIYDQNEVTSVILS